METTLAATVTAHRGGGSLTETIRATYARIEAHADPALFITLRAQDDALAAADRLAQAGPQGKPLFGVPFAVKDNIDVAGLPTTAACPSFAYTPERSAFVVQRLVDAGAIPIGKTNLDQFATGLVGVRSPYGVPRNALRADLIPGGSSSGSACAVGAGLVPFALGTDTAGSGRVPAALNGIVGLKPSLGALSAGGVVPACRTLDTVSIFALDVADAFAAFKVAAAFDPVDPFSRKYPPPELISPSGLRIGVPTTPEFFGDAGAQAAFTRDAAAVAALGFKLIEFDLSPFTEAARLLYEGPWVAERYAAAKPLIESRPDAMHPVTREIIEAARKFDAVATFEAFYKLAALRRETEAAWRGFDVMLVPTLPRFYTVEQVLADPVRLNSRLGIYTNFVNLLDLAAIAVPSGMRGDGLPSSLTLIAPNGTDGTLATLAAQIQAGSGATMGATGLAPPPAPEPVSGRIEIVVVGAHLTGLPLNRELIELGGRLERATRTTSDYRLYALPGTVPPKPGLLRVGDGEGAAIEVEVWSLGGPAFGAFVSKVPPPLGIGALRLEGGASAKGFLVEAQATRGAEDISGFGGWRAYLARR
jgi:allophanate hydrolase